MAGPAPVRGDPLWLRRALENLLGNAVQHSPEGEWVEMLVRNGVDCVAEVRDRGAGVDPAIRDRLFERFATTRHGEGGTGLGLAIVRAVAELHGGSAELVETLNKAGVPSGPILNVKEVFENEQVQHLGLAVPITSPTLGDLKVQRVPSTLSRTPGSVRMPTPESGEHNDEILRGLGYGPEDIARFRKEEII